jgi:small multidrug resistance family-3 protein
VIQNLGWFLLASLLQIGGCFAFWHWTRHHSPAWVPILGVGCLIGFAVALARVDAAFAGRAYAAYGGIYITASLAWLWLAEGQRPTATDALGAALAIGGALIIIGLAPKAP